MPSATILSIQIAPVETFGEFDAREPLDQRWTTAFFKRPVAGPVSIGWLGVKGDAQADRRLHGGPDKALLGYSAVHFGKWRREPGLAGLAGGGFGENLTIGGLTEQDVCIGDAWRVGGILLEVSQPRQPCWKLGRRWRRPDLPRRVVARGWTGWYFRVLEEGRAQAGQALLLERRAHPEWTIEAANRVMYGKRVPSENIRALVDLPTLSQAWKQELGERLLR